jgi:hypothetical protein
MPLRIRSGKHPGRSVPIFWNASLLTSSRSVMNSSYGAPQKRAFPQVVSKQSVRGRLLNCGSSLRLCETVDTLTSGTILLCRIANRLPGRIFG